MCVYVVHCFDTDPEDHIDMSGDEGNNSFEREDDVKTSEDVSDSERMLQNGVTCFFKTSQVFSKNRILLLRELQKYLA